MGLRDKVLAVDDDPVNLEIIEETLKNKCHLKVVSSGEAALEEIPKFKPDVVLLDIMMPGIDGYQTCQRIRNDPALKFTKILMISAKAMVSERLAGYEFGADDYITKPFNDEELLAKVKVYLRLKFFEELEELRRNTLTSIAQNIKNPLVSMLGAGSNLSEENTGELKTDILKSQLEQMRKSGQELMSFCNKAMLLCELKDGRDMVFEITAAEDIIGEVVKNFISQTREKGIKVSYKNTVNCAVRVDSQLIENALSSILQNAITYSPPNSGINILSTEENGRWVVMFEDQGAGLVQRVFSEISASDSNINHAGEGIGINVAKIIAQLHGGNMSFTPNAKGGMSFYFSIPFHKP